MKTFALLAIASASDKKVPPRHPLQRLARLNQFAQEWFVLTFKKIKQKFEKLKKN